MATTLMEPTAPESTGATDPTAATDPTGPTGILATWLAATGVDDIPSDVTARAKVLLLDGIGCLLVGAHLDWSTLGVEAITEFDGGGEYLIAGWGDRRTSAYSAAMLNSSFIQGFELDDYFPGAPLHSNAILIPAMLPLVEQRPHMHGAEFLAALVLGYEVGTRVGLSLHGPEMLSRGWHSGVVFGCAAAAASAGKLLDFSAATFEDALGMASTQACGLMSAQFESMIKRMQHGFASRAGLYGAVLASRGYVGIKRVFERSYGGFLPVFGEGHNPDAAQLTVDLGHRWITQEIAVKPYAAMGALHAGIDAAITIRAGKPVDPNQIKSILIEIGTAAYAHGGFEIQRPIAAVTAQMSIRYSVAVALLDGAALLKQYTNQRLNADDVWDLIGKTDVRKVPDFDNPPHTGYTTRLTVTRQDGSVQQELVEIPTGGVGRALTDDAVVSKFESLTRTVMTADRSAKIRDLVLTLEDRPMTELLNLLRPAVTNALA